MVYAAGVEGIVSHRTRGPHRALATTDRRPSVASQSTSEPLAAILENAILPRLMAAHGLAPLLRSPLDRGDRPVALDVEQIVPLAMDIDAGALLDHVDALLRQGVSIDSLFVDLLAPAARQLGVLWEEDRCDFVEVTMGLWRLQEVVRELAARFPPDRAPGMRANRALFAAMPGDQHSFGTVLVDETFRRQGWATDLAPEPKTAELIEHVARDWFDLVGLTVSCDCHIGRLPSLIRALRSVSRNPRVVVMVGGRIFVEDPAQALSVGADATAVDAVAALAVASGLVEAAARSCAA